MLRLINDVLLSPDNPVGGIAPPLEDKSIGQAGMEALLADDDDTQDEPEIIDLKPEKPPKEDEDEKAPEDEKDEDAEGDDKETEEGEEETLEDELEEDLKEPDENQLDELIAPVRRREILAKYPKLFKDFPYLEHAYYREQKYTELYPTIAEAQEAQEKAQTWDRFEGDLQEGNLENILASLAQSDKNTFHSVADNILSTIEKIDKPTATHIYSGIAKNIIELMVEASGQQNNENLKTAAHLVHQFLFGARAWEPHQPLAKPVERSPREDSVAKRERDFFERQFSSARDEVVSKSTNSIKATIDKNLDPKGTMSAYVKEKAAQDALLDVKTQMAGDKRFQAVLVKLWQDAAKRNFSDESKTAIRSAVVSKAKTLLLPAIQKARKTALGTVVRKANKDEVTRPEKTGPANKTGKTTSPMSGKTEKGKIPAGMSTRDFLLSD